MMPLNEYQTALYKVLSEIDCKVYDHVPSDAKFPFVSISDTNITDSSLKNGELFEIEQVIEVWSDYEGKKEVNRIASDIYEYAKKLIGANLNDNQSVGSIFLLPSQVSRLEGYYKANLIFKITIE